MADLAYLKKAMEHRAEMQNKPARTMMDVMREQIATRQAIPDSRIPADIYNGEQGLQGGFHLGTVGGVDVNATDLLPMDLGASALMKGAAAAKIGIPALLGMIGKAGKSGIEDAVKIADSKSMSVPIDFKNLSAKQSLELVKNTKLGQDLPAHDLLDVMPNKSIAQVKGYPNLRVKSLEDGTYRIENSPLWGSKEKLFTAQSGDLDELINASISRTKRSNTAISSQDKYSSIPTTWSGDEKQIAKKLIDEYGDVQFGSSTQSNSKYLTLPSGEKVRMSDHNLPNNYDSPDFDFRYGSDRDQFIQSIKDKLAANNETMSAPNSTNLLAGGATGAVGLGLLGNSQDSNAQGVTWQDTFKRVSGIPPESLGITTPEHADAALRRIAQLQSIQQPQVTPSDSYGSIGTRNEAIYPTRK